MYTISCADLKKPRDSNPWVQSLGVAVMAHKDKQGRRIHPSALEASVVVVVVVAPHRGAGPSPEPWPRHAGAACVALGGACPVVGFSAIALPYRTAPYLSEIIFMIGLRYGYQLHAGKYLTLPSSMSS